MATETDLAGLGISPFVAAKLGHQPTTLTAVGTTQTGAPTILTKNTLVNAATGATAVVLNPNADIGSPFFVLNPGTVASAASALVFVPSGHTLFNTNVTVNAAYTLAVQTAVVMWQASNKNWFIVS